MVPTADVEVSCGDIFGGPKAEAIISPANSFGEMTGGIDLVYIDRFDWQVQTRLQQLIENKHYGELPVGQADIVSTNDEDFPWLISAPTMRIPMVVKETVNAYLAFRAALIVAKENNIKSVLCPGLGTAIGKLPFDKCAKQMFYAYKTVIKGELEKFNHLGDCVNNHYSLVI